MTDFKKYITHTIASSSNTQNRTVPDLIQYCVDNRWFGHKPIVSNNNVFLTDELIAIYQPYIQNYIAVDYDTDSLLERFRNTFPTTASKYLEFCTENESDKETSFYVLQFLTYYVEKELVFYTDEEMSVFIGAAAIDLTKAHGDYLTFFIAWLRKKCKTSYYKDYTMKQRYTMELQNAAYSIDEYLELCYYLFNPDYITDNQMYQQAADSKNFTDTWLYLALHFVCSIRYTDLTRIYHPDLPYEPEEILERIKSDTFSANDARYVLLSITVRMRTLPFTPNKTKRGSGIADVKFHIPTSCEEHFGKLFALAEAHYQIAGDQTQPLIRKISTYREIKRYLGDEIGALFLESDFRSRSATKSYLQMIYLIGDEILAENNELDISGSVLASLARSHKGTFGEFASTTFEYLKDAKLSGLSPEFIAYELLERGVLSCIPSMLLKVLTNGAYNKLTVREQTELVQTLDLSPFEVETVISVIDESQKRAGLIVQQLISSETNISNVLQRIASGKAVSKNPDCMCLMTAMKQPCPYSNKRQCIGCEYEIGTKSTLYLIISEYNRMKRLYRSAESELEKQKYLQLLTTCIIPQMNDMLQCLRDDYGETVFYEYEQLIKENT